MKKLLIILTLILFISSLRAEIVTDGTLGPHQHVQGPNYLIGADLGQQHGPNLFHSFQLFNLNSGEMATFAGPDSIHNILARVTGGYQSEIDGTLFSAIPNVNLYFLNPYGIVFGEQARLDIPGSFHASTADYLRLGNHGYFSARHPNESVLTVAPVEAFGFLDNTPASITIQDGILQVSPEQSLSMIGGDLFIKNGTLLASGGQINLAAIASKGEFRITQTNLMMDGFVKLGEIEISQSSLMKRWIEFGGPERSPGNIDVSGFQGGLVFIRAGQFLLDKGFIFADTIQADGRGIDIQIDGNMLLKNGARITAQMLPSFEFEQIPENIQGGNINITANQLQLSGINEEPGIEEFLGLAPNDDEARKRSRFSTIGTDNFSVGTGKGGKIDIRTTNLEINSGFLQTATGGVSDAGNIHIRATDITLHKNGFINTSTASLGKAGNISLHAAETISLQYDSSISSACQENVCGQGGDIRLNSQHLILKNNAEINSYNHGSSDAGNIEIEVDTALLTHNGNITTYAKNAGGGDINLNIRHRLFMIDSWIAAQAEGMILGDDGGNVTIHEPQLFTLNNSNILASAKGGDGGDISITTNHFFQSSESVLNASSKLGIDGKIQINAPEENLDEELVALPQQYSDASRLLRTNCAEQTKDSFVITSKIPKVIIEDLLNSPQPPVFDGLSKTERLATYQEELAKVSKINFGLQASKINFGLQASKINLGLQAQSNALGRLAGLYAYERRYQEALHLNQRALNILLSQQEQAYETYLQQASQPEAFKLIQYAYLRYRWQWQRARFLNKNGQPDQAIAFYEKALATLEAIRLNLTQIYKNQPHSEIENIFKPLVQELVALRLQRADSLNKGPEKHRELKRILEIIEQLKAEQLRDYFKKDCIKPTPEIGDIDQNTAVIYPFFLRDSVELFVNLPANEIRNLTVAVTPDQLTAEIHQLRENLACQQEDYEVQRQCSKSLAYRKPAQKLYQWLIRPLEPLFSTRPIDTLVFVPDESLYTIPMAALYDGEQFLVEKYAIAVVPGLTLRRQPLTAQTVFQTGKIQVLYTGLTQSHTKSPEPLYYAEKMGETIKNIFVATDILQGQQFVKAEIETALLQKPYAIVHIMSHAQFKNVGPDTYVNTYDNKLWLDDFETLLAPTQFRKQPIELLALGACETAEGNERAAFGLSGIAFKAGARSAIGTLWEVYELASYHLFLAFYQSLNQTVSRAKLLQAAQQTLWQNYPDFRHPHYWSAFLLIGHWL